MFDVRGALAFQHLGRRESAVMLLEGGFVVEQLKVAWGAGHEQINDVFSFAVKMRPFRRERIGRGGDEIVGHEAFQGDRAEADTAFLKKPAARDFARRETMIKVRLAIHNFENDQ